MTLIGVLVRAYLPVGILGSDSSFSQIKILKKLVFTALMGYSRIRLIHPRLINPAGLLNPPRIKSKTGCPEVDLLTEFHCSVENKRTGSIVLTIGKALNRMPPRLSG